MAPLIDILERHCSEAAFLWTLRDAAVRDAAYTMRNLGDLDERVDANLDGLVLAGDAGWDVCKSALEEPEPGSVFTAMFVAVSRRDWPGVGRVLDVGAEEPALARAMVAAFGWAAFEDVNRMLPGLLDPRCPTELHYLGIAACSVHRRDPEGALDRALRSNDPRLRARAIRAAGELGRADLGPEARAALTSDDDTVRYWASWSAGLFGDAGGRDALLEIASSAGPFQLRACESAMRCSDVSRGGAWLQSSFAASPRIFLTGAASLGDPSLVPRILECLGDSRLARISGDALHRITGLDLSAPRLRSAPPDGFQSGPSDDPNDDDVAMDPDASLPWPNVGTVTSWWHQAQKQFLAGTRYLLGKPMDTAGWLDTALRLGSQPDRAAAAEERHRRTPKALLFQVRAPANRKRAELA